MSDEGESQKQETQVGEQSAKDTTAEVLGADGKPFDPARAQALIDKLREEVKALKPKAQKAEEYEEELRKAEEAKLSEVDRLKREAERLQAQLQAVQLQTLKSNVAMKHNISAWADRLVGNTEEELEADALRIVALTKPDDKEKGKKVGKETNPADPSYVTATPAERKKAIFGDSVEVWDINRVTPIKEE